MFRPFFFIIIFYMKDYYKILEITKDADSTTIKKSYKKLAFKYHPDKNINNKEEAEKKFKLISEAYTCLSDPAKRKMYDLTGSTSNNMNQENPFEMFNNIFKMHVQNFMNIGTNLRQNNESGGGLADILNDLKNSSGTSIPFGGIRFNINSFVKQPTKQSNPPKNIREKPKDLIYSILLNIKDIYNNSKKKIKIERIRMHGDKNMGVCKKEKYDFEINVSNRIIKLIGQGNELKNYSEAGDIVIYTKFKSDKYSRKNDDLMIHEEFDSTSYYLKNIHQFRLPNKKILNVKLTDEQLNKPHNVLKVTGLGFVKENGERGDCYIILNSFMPKKDDFGKNLGKFLNYEDQKNIIEGIVYNCDILNLIDII